MGKKVQYYLVFVTFTIGVMFGAFYCSFVLAKKPDVGTYEIQLQTLEGEPLNEYDWGVFALRETKSFECNLVYLGNAKAKTTWNMTDLQGWNLEVWDISDRKPKLWEDGSYISCKPGETWKLRIKMREINAIPNQIMSIDLNFFTVIPDK